MAEVQLVLANSFAKVRIFHDITSKLTENRSLNFPIVTFATTNNKEQAAVRKNTNFATRVITIKLVRI